MRREDNNLVSIGPHLEAQCGSQNGSKLKALRASIATVKANFMVHSAICIELEKLADTLPRDFSRQKSLHLSRLILPALKRAHKFEEHVLFPLLEDVFKSNNRLKNSLERLRHEHCEDECCAEDVSLTLLDCGSSGVVKNPDMTGYLLRSLFEGVRRHTAFEREHVLPMAEMVLDKSQYHPS